MKTHRTLLICLLALFSQQIYAQLPYVPDSTYGLNGIAAPNTYVNGVWIHRMFASVLQADGKMVLAGDGNFSNSIEVVRLKSDGTLDNTFNGTGHAVFNANGSYPWAFVGIKVGTDGRIFVGYYSQNPGNTRYTVLCLLPNGTIDPSYGSGGKAEIGPALAGTEVLMTCMEMQADGKIVLGGGGPDAQFTHKYVLARITTTGQPDPTFGTGGVAKCPFYIGATRNVEVHALRMQSDGKILAAGLIPPGPQGYPDTTIMIRYKSNGTLDSTYGTNGIAKLAAKSFAGALRIDAANDAYMLTAAGLVLPPDSFYIWKFSSSGALVPGWGMNGRLTIPARFNVFNDHEQYRNNGRFELLANGQFVIGGTSDSSSASAFRVIRLLASGQPDLTFAPNGTITVPRSKRDLCTDLVVQPDGKIILTGYYRTGEGSFDTARVLAMRFRQQGSTGIATVAAGLNAVIYPNPVTQHHFTLTYNNTGKAGTATFALVNAIGQRVAEGGCYLQHGQGTWQASFENQGSPGLYYLHLTTVEHKTETVKLLVQ